jgi:predicted ATP-dependent endonuclease of OLD family
MKLNKVHIRTYRSIVDSGEVNIDEGVTVVVGKNEQGKTTFLRGIKSFNSDERFAPSDFPNHLRPALEEKSPDKIQMVTLTFTLESSDRERLKDTVIGIKDASALKCTKYYDNHYEFWVVKIDESEEPLKFEPPDISAPVTKIKQIIGELKTKLQAHAQRLTTFAVNQEKIEQITSAVAGADFRDATKIENIFSTFATSMKALTGSDKPILDDITAATTGLEAAGVAIKTVYQQDLSRSLIQSLPRFIFHSTKTDQIPNEVNVEKFVADSDGVSKGMSNLCRAAGLSIQKISELASTGDTAQREAYEDHYKGTISGGLNEFWTQTEYNVHFRIDKERLSVSISDGKYVQRIPPSDRSEGFQWYLSFFAALLNDVGVSHQTVLLLDNPGAELHLDGQRDIKRFLEERVALTSQVIYVTHSPAMIDAFNLRQVRTVELHKNQFGTKVDNFAVGNPESADLLEPVRAAIGMSLVTSLVLNEWNILIEGAADKPIVEGIFYKHYSEHANKVLVNGSLSESKDSFLARFYNRTGLPYVILLDADSGGRELFNELIRMGIPEARIVKLDTVFKDKKGDFAMEDILSANFYHKAVEAAYPSNPVPPQNGKEKKIARQYEEVFKESHKFGFNKRRVADAAKRLLKAGTEDEETRNNLGKLSGVLVENLKAQVSIASSNTSETSKQKK